GDAWHAQSRFGDVARRVIIGGRSPERAASGPPGRGRNAMLELLESQTRLTGNQKKIIAAAVIGDMLDYFDFGLIGYALAFIVGPWHLTYGQSAMILLTSGIGGVPGALFYGWLADRIGRRTVFIMTALNFSIATGVMAVTPDTGG